jgi:hypothetical protein
MVLTTEGATWALSAVMGVIAPETADKGGYMAESISAGGLRMPVTWNHWPPTQIRIPGEIRSMPSSRALAAPSTATGSRAVTACP